MKDWWKYAVALVVGICVSAMAFDYYNTRKLAHQAQPNLEAAGNSLINYTNTQIGNLVRGTTPPPAPQPEPEVEPEIEEDPDV